MARELERLRAAGFGDAACAEFVARTPFEQQLQLLEAGKLDSEQREALLAIVEGLLTNESVFSAVFLEPSTPAAQALLSTAAEEVMPVLARTLRRHTPLMSRALAAAAEAGSPLATDLLAGVFFLLCEEHTECSVAALHFLCHLAAQGTLLEGPLFLAKLQEVLAHPHAVVRVRALEVLFNTAAVSPRLAEVYAGQGLFEASLRVYREAAGDTLARMSVIEVMKVGGAVRPFLELMARQELAREFLAELQDPQTELYLRRDLSVLCILLQKARPAPSTQPLAPFLELARTFLKAEGEEFTAGVEIMLHLLEFVEVMREVLQASEPKQLLTLERKRDYEQAKLRALKVDALVGEKWSLAAGREAPLAQELFEGFFRLFYGREELGTDRCVDALFENIRLATSDAEELNLRVLLKLLDYPALFEHVLHMQRAEELIAHLASGSARGGEVLELRREARARIAARIDELGQKDENVMRLLAALRGPGAAGADVRTAAQ